MGTAASVEATAQKDGVVITSSQPSSSEDPAIFGNTVIDTTLQFSQEPGLQDKEIAAKYYEKSETVRSVIRTALKGKFIFQTLTGKQIEKIIDVFSPISCVVGERIIKQGAVGEYMYVVENGLFEVTKRGEGKLSECGEGQTFGELALLYNAKRSATVTCIQDASIWALDRHTFRHYRASSDKKLETLALEVLAHVPLLKDLQYAQFARAAEVARTVEFKEGDMIIRKGEVGHTFYIVLDGVVNCSEAPVVDEGNRGAAASEDKSESGGDATRRALLPAGGVRLKAGEWFGEIALLTGSVRTANVVADSSVRLLAFDRNAFEKVLGSLRDIIDSKANNRMLSDLSFISKLPQIKQDAAVGMFYIESFSDGEVICNCGDPNPRFILLKSGKATVWRHPDPVSLAEVVNDRSGSEERSRIIEERNIGDTWNEINEPSDAPPPLDAPAGFTQQAQGNHVEESTNMINNLTISGENAKAVKRSLPGSFEKSFTSFEMHSFSASFSESRMGRAEARWRKLQRKQSCISEGAQQEEKGQEQEEKADDDLEFVHGDTFVLSIGEHLGSQAIFNGTPMDCTVIADGDVSCFVLTREDWHLISSEEEEDSLYSTSSLNHSFVSEAPPSSSVQSAAAQERMRIASTTSNDTGIGSIDRPPDIQIDWSKLTNLGQIGAGTFGTVYIMQYAVNNATFAMKVLDRSKVKRMRQERRLETEQMLLKSLHSPFISRLYGEMQDDSAYYLLLELVQGGELKRLIHPAESHLRAKQKLEAEAGMLAGIPHQPAKFYVASISLPLVYLHRRSIAYRDLKPENIMIDRFGYPKLIDFGLAKPLDATTGRTHSLCGTPEYLAPEVILGTGHNHAVDWWALGVLLYEMIVGLSPFLERGVDRKKQDHMVIFQNIIENRTSYSPHLEPQCTDLIQRLLTVKPAFRMGCGIRAHKEFEEHDWFLGVVDWYALGKRQVAPPWFPPLHDQTDRSCLE